MSTDYSYRTDMRGVREVLDINTYGNPAGMMTCGVCGRTWDDTIATRWTPVPSGRCPFEHMHPDPPEPDTRSVHYDEAVELAYSSPHAAQVIATLALVDAVRDLITTIERSR
jgi:hypothetical protein